MRRNAYLSFLLINSVLITGFVQSQELEAYRIYSEKGKSADFGDVVKDATKADVLLFGEFHNNPICHWMQLELVKAAYKSDRNLVLGAEMFETDDQVVLNEYLADQITIEHLKKEAKVWPNFQTDYRPLVDFAKDSGLAFIATNVPRRYASLVSKKGQSALDSLSDQAKGFMPELPFEVTTNDPGYIEMREMMAFHGGGVGLENMIAAQALKDYTMAYNIYENLPEKGLFIHFNGSFHSQMKAGIYNYLKARDKRLKVLVIAVVEEDDLSFQEDWKTLGDYILVVPSSMTKTH